MQVFAPTPFRYSGVDYKYGYQDLDQSLADTLIAAGLVRSTVPGAAGGGITALTQASDYSNNLSTPIANLNSSVSTNTSSIATLQAAQSTISDNAQTGTTYTFALGDAGQNVDLSNAAAITATIPPHSSVAFPVGTMLYWTQAGAGGVTIAGGAGVTLQKRSSFSLSTTEQYATGYAYQVSQDVWRVYNA